MDEVDKMTAILARHNETLKNILKRLEELKKNNPTLADVIAFEREAETEWQYSNYLVEEAEKLLA